MQQFTVCWHWVYSLVRLDFRMRCPSPTRLPHYSRGVRCSSVVRAFAHGVIGRRIDPSWGGPLELFFVPASAPRLV